MSTQPQAHPVIETARGEEGQVDNGEGPMVRELVSLSVAVTARCDGCIAIHVDAGQTLGVANVARLSVFHFAHVFKGTTGFAPH